MVCWHSELSSDWRNAWGWNKDDKDCFLPMVLFFFLYGTIACLNIVRTKSLEDASLMSTFRISSILALINLVEDTLVGKMLWQRFQSRFYWPTLFKDLYEYCKRCLRYQQMGKTGKKDMMPLTRIIIVDIFDV